MKAILITAFFSLLVVMQLFGDDNQFGDDNVSGDWLPLPDGYTWEAPLKDAPDFEPSTKEYQTLPKELRKGIADHWPGESLPNSLELFEIDLNTDGKNEILLPIHAYSGTGGIFYWILTPEGETYRSVGRIFKDGDSASTRQRMIGTRSRA